MLAVRDLRVQYRGSILGLRSVTVDVPQGAVVAVLGSNGAGKTTLLRAASGVLAEHGGRIANGTIEFEGRSLVGRSPAAIVADHLFVVRATSSGCIGRIGFSIASSKERPV